MSAIAEEIARLKVEHADLTTEVADLAAQLEEIDATRRPISAAFSAAWNRRDKIERELATLEGKVKVCRPVLGERKSTSTKKAQNIEGAIKELSKGELLNLQKLVMKLAGIGEKK